MSGIVMNHNRIGHLDRIFDPTRLRVGWCLCEGKAQRGCSEKAMEKRAVW
jgi:hypothetical protein